ncbi:MAG TPA: hypothetical protein VFY93_16535 [Planctomycetota bacterium]|nr:hypothetical protein [Planctomycetota bacterium]
MSRGNIALLGALVVAVGLWLIGQNWATDRLSGPVPRLFPEFNREGADTIEISGGVNGTKWVIARPEGAPWSFVSVGGYPVKREEVDHFLDAVKSLRKDNPVGGSAEMRASTQTDEKNGRLVRILRADQPLAEFYVGKQPKQGYHEFFIRKADEDAIYRTTTLLDRDRGAPSDAGSRAAGFEWDAYTQEMSRRWIDSEIWDLGGAEAQAVRIDRRDHYDATVEKEASDKWNLIEAGKEPVPADADVADGMLSVVRRLSLYEVAGKYDDVRDEYGLDKPEITLLMTLRKKAGKPAPEEGEKKEGETKEGEEKKDEAPKEEWVTFTRTLEVGKKVTRQRYDSYSDAMKSEDYYAVRVDPKYIDDPKEKARAEYVFLVRDYTASSLRKELSELKAKAKEEEKGAGEGGEGRPAEGQKPSDEKKPAEDKPADAQKPADAKEPADGKKAGDEEKPADEKPADEKPADEEPKDSTESPKDACGCGG